MKRHFAPKGSLIAAVDVGTAKTVCFIARVIDERGDFEILGVGNHKSQGIRAGVIADLDAAEMVIRKAVHAAENMAASVTKGYPLREVVINVPGTHAISHCRTVDVQIAGHEVTDKDIKAALHLAQSDIEIDDEKQSLIHTIPVGYRIDGTDGISDPHGMVGQLLSADIHMMAADKSLMRNITRCTDRSHLDIAAFCSSVYAAGLSCLVEDEMDLGCTVIEMGAGVTSFAVMHNGAALYTDAIAIGGDHVTKDIAAGLTTSLADAERLKILYGAAMVAALDDAELIDVPKLGEEDRRQPNHVPRSLLIGIIHPRLEEIFELIRAKIKDSGLAGIAGRRVVLTGGAAQMNGLRELAGNVLDKQVRIGKPVQTHGLPDAVSGPAFSSASGMLAYIAQRPNEISGTQGQAMSAGSMIEAVKLWLRENW
jgi:cell division protein FtsA